VSIVRTDTCTDTCRAHVASNRIETMSRSAFRIISQSGAVDALLLMGYPHC
jgi:hypothetical protein